jgi:hypothetical protein
MILLEESSKQIHGSLKRNSQEVERLVTRMDIIGHFKIPA